MGKAGDEVNSKPGFRAPGCRCRSRRVAAPTCHRLGLVYNLATMPPGPPSPVGSDAEPEAIAAVADSHEHGRGAQTALSLRLLGVVFLLTLVPWASAKVACNLRDSPVRPPPELDLKVIIQRPKSAGLEFSQRLASGDFRAASELARGDLARELLQQAAACDQNPDACSSAPAGSIHTRAVLRTRRHDAAEVTTASHGGLSGVQRLELELGRDATGWAVIARRPAADESPAGHLTPGASVEP